MEFLHYPYSDAEFIFLLCIQSQPKTGGSQSILSSLCIQTEGPALPQGPPSQEIRLMVRLAGRLPSRTNPSDPLEM